MLLLVRVIKVFMLFFVILYLKKIIKCLIIWNLSFLVEIIYEVLNN